MLTWIKSRELSLGALGILGATLLSAPAVLADHQWASYHWERDGVDPLILSIGDNHSSSVWSAIFDEVVANWGLSPSFDGHLDTSAVDGGAGDIESFDDDYGNTGWLGLASIWVSRGKNKHIQRGESKVNEYYITLPGYDEFNDPGEWQHVMCQEIGHTFGLDHNRDGDSCMNDGKPLEFPTPNAHDFELLDQMYAEDHGGGGDGGSKKCHPVFGCPGVAVGHVVWAEQYDSEEEMFDAADLVVDATVLSSSFDRMVGRSDRAVPVTRVVLKVSETYNGRSRPVIVLEQTRGRGLEIDDDPGYVQGDSYTLYLREIDNNTYRTVNPEGRIRQ